MQITRFEAEFCPVIYDYEYRTSISLQACRNGINFLLPLTSYQLKKKKKLRSQYKFNIILRTKEYNHIKAHFFFFCFSKKKKKNILFIKKEKEK